MVRIVTLEKKIEIISFVHKSRKLLEAFLCGLHQSQNSDRKM